MSDVSEWHPRVDMMYLCQTYPWVNALATVAKLFRVSQRRYSAVLMV